MYFTPEKAREVGSRFFNCLNDGGWLITSQVELSDNYFSRFARKQYLNGIYYHKSQKPVAQTRSADQTKPVVKADQAAHLNRKSIDPSKVPVPPLKEKSAKSSVAVALNASPPSLTALLAKGDYQACVKECHRLIESGSFDTGILTHLVESYANLGQLKEARVWAEKHIANNGTKAGSYHLLSIILLELNELSEAEIVLKKALYLEPDHLFAHLTMGNVLKRLGKLPLAARHFRNVAVLMEALPDDEVVPGSDGLTAGRIRQMITIS
jgi:chemotaxis protein methyltransferase CheR